MLATRPVLFNRNSKKEVMSMPFTLITENGKKMKFYLEATARLYKSLYGGTLTKE